VETEVTGARVDRWRDMTALVCDREGRVFAAAQVDINPADDHHLPCWTPRVWCRGPDGALAWLLDRDLGLGEDVRLAMDREGRYLVAWSPHHPSAVRINPNDGRPLGPLGGSEPEAARTPHLDFSCCEALDFDEDGSLLALLRGRLLRFSVDGASLRTWPRPPAHWDIASFGLLGRERRPPLSVEKQGLSSTKSFLSPQPLALPLGSTFAFGWDGYLYVIAPYAHETRLHRIGRDGRILYGVALPGERGEWSPPRIDSRGHVVLVTGSSLFRFSPDKAEIESLIVDPTSRAYIEKVAVSPNGTIRLGMISDPNGTRIEEVSVDVPVRERKTLSLRPMRRLQTALVLGILLLLTAARLVVLESSIAPALERARDERVTLVENSAFRLSRSSADRLLPEESARLLTRIPLVFILEGAAALFLILALAVATRHPLKALLQSIPAVVLTTPLALIVIPVLGRDLFTLYTFVFSYLPLLGVLSFAMPFVWSYGIASLYTRSR